MRNSTFQCLPTGGRLVNSLTPSARSRVHITLAILEAAWTCSCGLAEVRVASDSRTARQFGPGVGALVNSRLPSALWRCHTVACPGADSAGKSNKAR